MRNQSIRSTAVGKSKITGQGMTEYIIIVALIAIAAIAAVGFFGSSVKTQFVVMGQELVGEDAVVAVQAPPAGTDTASRLNTYTAN